MAFELNSNKLGELVNTSSSNTSIDNRHESFKIYDPFEKIFVEILGFRLSITSNESPEYNASVGNIYAMIIKYNCVIKNDSIEIYFQSAPRCDGVRIEICDDHDKIDGDYKKKYSATTYCNEFAIGPIVVTENRKTMILGDRYVLHTINGGKNLFTTDLFNFANNNNDSIIGVAFGWPIKLDMLQQCKTWMDNTVNIMPIPERSMSQGEFALAKAAQDITTSSAELSNVHCVQLRCDLVFKEMVVENILSRAIIDYETDRLNTTFGNLCFDQFLEEDHTHLMELVIYKYFGDLKKLKQVVSTCDIHSVNILKSFVMAIVVLAGIDGNAYPYLPLLISTILRGGSIDFALESENLIATEIYEYCDNLKMAHNNGILFDGFLEGGCDLVPVVKHIYYKLKNVLSPDDKPSENLISDCIQLLTTILATIINSKIPTTQNEGELYHWFVKSSGTYFEKYSWCFTGSTSVDYSILNNQARKIKCANGTSIRIIATFCGGDMVKGVDVVGATVHYAYGGLYNSTRQWIKIPADYIPLNIFIQTYSEYEDYYELFDAIYEHIESTGLIDIFKQNKSFASIKVNIDNTFDILQTEPPLKQQFSEYNMALLNPSRSSEKSIPIRIATGISAQKKITSPSELYQRGHAKVAEIIKINNYNQ